ncbi:hypothetical protein L873DRAFT_657498 [Choiromyces venosus 120613-1]|uniref:Uncharacterized protein n=1 Tax=Choiromyces venosus 120613-1 TaxID=1336337 RepID=A0A3N4K698_9PEZI|nr:hypothetical protein L873DRAFT_657498 [Choiromyces venosus 120613-1]
MTTTGSGIIVGRSHFPLRSFFSNCFSSLSASTRFFLFFQGLSGGGTTKWVTEWSWQPGWTRAEAKSKIWLGFRSFSFFYRDDDMVKNEPITSSALRYSSTIQYCTETDAISVTHTTAQLLPSVQKEGQSNREAPRHLVISSSRLPYNKRSPLGQGFLSPLNKIISQTPSLWLLCELI